MKLWAMRVGLTLAMVRPDPPDTTTHFARIDPFISGIWNNFLGSRASITTQSPLPGHSADDPRPRCGAERAEAPRGTRCRVYTARTRRSARRVRADSGLNVARRQPTAWAACGGQRAVGRLQRPLWCFLVAATARAAPHGPCAAAEARQRR